MFGCKIKSLELPLLLTTLVFCSVESTCDWSADITSFNSPNIPVSIVHNNVTKVSVTAQISSLDVYNLRQNVDGNTEVDYYAYPYYVRLRLICHHSPSSGSISRSLALQGIRPVITVSQSPERKDGRELADVVVDLTADLVDFSQDGSCSGFDLCDPVWMTPLPMDMAASKVEICVRTTAITNIPDICFSVSPVGFHQTSSTNLLGTIINASTTHLKTLYDSSPGPEQLNMLAGSTFGTLTPFRNGEMILYSEDEFMSTSLIEVSVLKQLSGEYQCAATSRIIYESVALIDRLLLSTSLGLVEIHIQSGRVTLSLAVCVSQFLIGHQYGLDQPLVGVITDKEEVYSASYRINKGEPLSMTQLPHICSSSHLDLVTTCSLIGGAIDPNHVGHVILLVDIVTNGKRHYYRLLRYSNESGYALLNAVLPAKLIFPSDTNPEFTLMTSSLYDTTIDASGSLDGYDDLIITGLDFTVTVTNQLYIWGNRLLTSRDGGDSVYLLSQYDGTSGNIISFTSSTDGYFVFSTSTNQVWAGSMGDGRLRQIYPSYSWSIHSLTSTIHDPPTLTYFFDQRNQLQQVILCSTDVGSNDVTGTSRTDVTRRSIQLKSILATEIYQTNVAVQQPTTGATPTHGISQSEEDPGYISAACPYSRISVVYSSDGSVGTSRQLYHFSPLQSTKSTTNSSMNDRLVAYQAVTEKLLRLESQAAHSTYADRYTDQITRWRHEHDKEAYIHYLFRHDLLAGGLHVELSDYEKSLTGEEDPSVTPADINLDQGGSFTFTLTLYLSLDHTAEYESRLDDVGLDVTSSDPKLLHIQVDRYVHLINNTIQYVVTLRDLSQVSDQYRPGSHRPILTVTVIVMPVCLFSTLHDNQFNINVKLGCSSTKSLQLNMEKHKERVEASPNIYWYDCWMDVDPDKPCVYADNDFYPYFEILDQRNGEKSLYMSNYSLIILGAGNNDHDLVMFTEEQVAFYNNPDIGGKGLIWGAKNSLDKVNGFPIYNRENNAIRWLCEVFSPCANVKAHPPYSPQYVFLVELSNMNVESSTYCDLTTRFTLRVHGLPMDAISTYSLIVILTMAVLCMYLMIYFWCHKGRRGIKMNIPARIAPFTFGLEKTKSL